MSNAMHRSRPYASNTNNPHIVFSNSGTGSRPRDRRISKSLRITRFLGPPLPLCCRGSPGPVTSRRPLSCHRLNSPAEEFLRNPPGSSHFAAGRRAGAAKCGDDWLWSVRSVAFRSSGRRIGRISAIRTHIRQHTAPPWALMRLFSVKISQNRRRHGKIQCILNCPQPPF